MQGSEDRWHPVRVIGFLALGLMLYVGLFIWSDRVRETHAGRNPFHRITQAPIQSDWIILGASHALPLGFDGIPTSLRAATTQSTLTLAVPGGGPAVTRLVAERYFADHEAGGVLVVLDAFTFADPRWNEDRLGDNDILPKMPTDPLTFRVLLRAVPRGLPVGTFLAYATGFARINDRARFETDRWEAEDRFENTSRPSEAADAARVTYLYPDVASEASIQRGLADIEALIALARAKGARIVLVFPPLPERFQTRLPEIPDLQPRLAALAGRLGVPLIDHQGLIPDAQFYFDTDHLNRSGVQLWLERGLGPILQGEE